MRETHGQKIARIESNFAKEVKTTLCKDCSTLLTEENQYPSCRKRGQHCCKKCWNQRFYYAVKKGRYGISLNKIDKILESQKYKCAICETHLVRARTAVDHCHDSGRVRGLLCKTCNSGIGMLRDSADIVHKALTYLQERREVDLREVDFGEAPSKPPLMMDEKNIARREYVAKNLENIQRIDREYRARKKVSQPVKETHEKEIKAG